jgi:GrpB-like predicted nucleotidyltransferase (UPF0157 family)
MERYGAGQIVVADYDPDWPRMFEQERARLSAALGPLVLIIEHIGSTAVPGLAAKPIIDLLVGVQSLTEAESRSIETLSAMGYAYFPEYKSWLPDELFFRKGIPWTHHAHVMEPSNPRWESLLLFRDYLRAHSDAARAYATLKRDLAVTFRDDIAAYRTAKNDFVADVIAKAARGRRQPQRS